MNGRFLPIVLRFFRSVARQRAMACALVTFVAAAPVGAQPEGPATPLQLEAKIALGDVRGRIDHMAIDLARRRLYVAELGNDSVSIVDLDARKVMHRIFRLSEPQGVAYVPGSDALYVANARDGSVRIFRAGDFSSAGRIDLGDDADNIRVARDRVFVGYGDGALAAIDPSSGKKVADIKLKAHPESFQLEPDGRRIFVNLPKAHAIAVVDRESGKDVSHWPMHGSGNFPMAVDRETKQVLVVFRDPARLVVLSMRGGEVIANAATCGDADDVFVDPKRRLVFVSCGEGVVDVHDAHDPTHPRVARIPTVAGARTSLFVPEMDRLYVAVRARGGEPAAIWVFRPTS
jgi:YVTN family beta-propeller protein